MITYPLNFQARTKSPSGMQSAWKSGPEGMEVVCTVPTEFEGPGGGLSPEDLYLGALTNCFVATFKVYAEHSKLTFEEVEVESSLVVDLDDKKRPVMKEAEFAVKIKGASNVDRARLLAKKASESGFVLNSVKSALKFSFEIS
jgi:organic hydroperoxide reductase OsmC/OhrA